MKARLDRFGRIVLPKDIRDGFSLEPGDTLEIRATSEGILLKRRAAERDVEPSRNIEGVLVFDGSPSEAIEGAIKGAIEGERQVRLAKLAGRRRTKARAPRMGRA